MNADARGIDWLVGVRLGAVAISVGLGAQCGQPFREITYWETHFDLCQMILDEGLECLDGEEGCEPFVCMEDRLTGPCAVEFIVLAHPADVGALGDEFCPQIEYSRREVDVPPFYFEALPPLCGGPESAVEGVVPVCVSFDGGGSCG